MKALCVILGLATLPLFLCGCESDVPPSSSDENAGAALQRGITGQGTLYQPDRTNDPLIREQSRVGY